MEHEKGNTVIGHGKGILKVNMEKEHGNGICKKMVVEYDKGT